VTLIDTNVALRFGITTDPLHGTVKAAVDALKRQGEDLRTVPQNMYELWVTATRPLARNGFGLNVAECVQFVAKIEAAFPVLPDPQDLYDRWKALVTAHNCQGKAAHDARLVAAMQAHGVARLLTFNGADFTRYPGAVVLDPATIAATP
jgi:predicted nucleic acid-binding protein